MQLLASRRAEMLQGIGGTAITGNETADRLRAPGPNARILMSGRRPH